MTSWARMAKLSESCAIRAQLGISCLCRMAQLSLTYGTAHSAASVVWLSLTYGTAHSAASVVWHSCLYHSPPSMRTNLISRACDTRPHARMYLISSTSPLSLTYPLPSSLTYQLPLSLDYYHHDTIYV